MRILQPRRSRAAPIAWPSAARASITPTPLAPSRGRARSPGAVAARRVWPVRRGRVRGPRTLRPTKPTGSGSTSARAPPRRRAQTRVPNPREDHGGPARPLDRRPTMPLGEPGSATNRSVAGVQERTPPAPDALFGACAVSGYLLNPVSEPVPARSSVQAPSPSLSPRLSMLRRTWCRPRPTISVQPCAAVPTDRAVRSRKGTAAVEMSPAASVRGTTAFGPVSASSTAS
jgi:hypothetical protein